MSNLPLLNFPAFNATADRLRALGYTVVNPAEINGGADELDATACMTPDEHAAHWRACMKRDIPALLSCDAIAMLPGWERSRGACLEHLIATELGMPVLDAHEIVDLVDFGQTGAAGSIALKLRYWARTGDELAAFVRGRSADIQTAYLVHDQARVELLQAVVEGGVQ